MSASACSSGRDAKPNAAAAPESTSVSKGAPEVFGSDVKSWTVTAEGFGPLRAGMTFSAASDSLKGALRAEAGANLNECTYVQWVDGPRGLLVMVEAGKIARIDITTPDIATSTGAHVGDTEAHVKSLYPDAVVTPHKYEDGHYLTVKSANISDSTSRLIFETASGRVTRFRAGLLPAVEYVEGCS